MFKDAEKQLETILKVVEKCPESLKERCFEILLTAYAEAAACAPDPRAASQPIQHTPPPPPGPPAGTGSHVPASLQQRFGVMAKRLEIPQPMLERLFDFSAEPFTLHAYSVPGGKTFEKVRNVALLVAAKSYLATAVWAADAKEVKAECSNQSCYDPDNFWKAFDKSGDDWFKPIASGSGKPIELTSAGVKAAEALLKTLAEQP